MKGNTTGTLARAQIYWCLSRAFAYPDAALLQEIGQARDQLARSAAELDVKDGLRQALDKLFQALARASVDALQDAYSALFTGREQSRLNEADYDKGPFSMANRLADVTGFYLAFGLQPREGSGERPDFIATQAEFMHALLVKQAYAQERGWAEQADVCADAEGKFLRDHFLWWTPMLCMALRKTASDPFYRALSEVLQAFIALEQEKWVS